VVCCSYVCNELLLMVPAVITLKHMCSAVLCCDVGAAARRPNCWMLCSSMRPSGTLVR
jgi:hypothetical protein